MANEKIEKLLVEDLEFCCPYGYFYAMRRKRTAELVKVLDVSRSSVKRWRRNFKLGKLKCSAEATCRLREDS